jgi:hypothetical protein
MKIIFAMGLLFLLGACSAVSGLATDTTRVVNDLGNTLGDVVNTAADVVVNTATDVNNTITQIVPSSPAQGGVSQY